MNEMLHHWLPLVLAWMAGGVLGVFFFGGLWWTILKGVSSNRATYWFLGSLLVRTVSVLVGFYVILGGHWDRLVAGLLGFVLARFIMTRLIHLPAEAHLASSKEPGHAP